MLTRWGFDPCLRALVRLQADDITEVSHVCATVKHLASIHTADNATVYGKVAALNINHCPSRRGSRHFCSALLE